jgi:hypothetical protein
MYNFYLCAAEVSAQKLRAHQEPLIRSRYEKQALYITGRAIKFNKRFFIDKLISPMYNLANYPVEYVPFA